MICYDEQMSTLCPVERLLCHLQGQDHSEGSYNQTGENMTVFYYILTQMDLFACVSHAEILLHPVLFDGTPS